MQTPDAPRLAADGSVTAMAKYIATAASVALPPAQQHIASNLGGTAFIGSDGGEGRTRRILLSGAR